MDPRLHTEALLRVIEEAVCVGELVMDARGKPCGRRLLQANPRYHELLAAAGAEPEAQADPPEFNAGFEPCAKALAGGSVQHFGICLPAAGRWFDVQVSRIGSADSRIYAAVFHETTDQKRREADLAFLSGTSRDLLGVTDALQAVNSMGAGLGRHLGVSGCAYAAIDAAASHLTVSCEWHARAGRSVIGTYRLADLLAAECIDALGAGMPVALADVRSDPQSNAEALAVLGIASLICVPIHADGVWRGLLLVHHDAPRQWRRDEIRLVRELTDRLWTRLEQLRAEEAWRASDARHQALFSQMVGGVAEADLDGRFTSVNRRYCEIVGYTADELLRMRMQDISHPGEYALNHELVQRLIRDRQPFEIEKRYVRKDGSAVWVHNSVSPVGDASGRTRGIISVSVDITERKRQEEQLRRGAELLNLIVDRSPAGFYIVDADFRISHLNADSQARAFRNVNPAIGRRFDEAIRVMWPEPVATEVIGIFRHTLETGEPYVSPGLVSRRADIEGVETYEWQVQRITMPDGRHAVMCYYYDTTRLRAVEQELREADRRKDEFLATLAHELRNPLAPLRVGLHLLRRLPPGTQGTDLHEMMDRQLKHLVRLVDDLMEVSRITRGKVELRRERVDLASVIHGAVETSRPLIESGGHQLRVGLAEESMLLDADPVRLTQVFANLLNNAAKYTDSGGLIEVESRREGTQAVVSVRDNGAGIPADMLGRIFDLFTQADRTFGRAQGGLGIGLTLVRSIVDLHGGSIEARSEGAGRGSEFIVRLPLAVQVEQAVEEEVRRTG